MVKTSASLSHSQVIVYDIVHHERFGISSCCKFLTSSLLRNLYDGEIKVFRNLEQPLYKIDRRQIHETYVPIEVEDTDVLFQNGPVWEFLDSLPGRIPVDSSEWLIFVDPSSIVLRNIEHLLPRASTFVDRYSPEPYDFLYTPRTGLAGRQGASVSTGIWAVRRRHLELVLDLWKSRWVSSQMPTPLDEEEIWSRVVEDIPLRKRAFENGEVVAPRHDSVNWGQISMASVVTLPDWPKLMQNQFIQALYFGTFFGDKTGLMINILDT